jgi:hypothetical protein
MKFPLLLLSFFALLCSCWANANEFNGGIDGETKKTDVTGGVYHHETKKPLNNVTITAYTSKKEKVVSSDANGTFSFDDLKPGTYTFVFEKEGYKKVTKEKTIARADEAHQLNIHMQEHEVFDFTPGPSHFFEF